jgi:putative tryptophan/tyrosine transport system substrate-binding protein
MRFDQLRRRQFIAVLGGIAAMPMNARAQQTSQIRRIGVLMPESEGSAESRTRVAAFDTRLRELGWTPGRNLQIDYRWAMGNPEKTRAAAQDLVKSAPDILVAAATPSLVETQRATRTIPIVFIAVSEPVASGFVASLARPGGNATGFSNLEPTFGGKSLELLKEIAPPVSRVAVMFNQPTAFLDSYFHSVEAAAPRFSATAIKVLVRTPEEIEAIMTTLGREAGGGLILPPDPYTAQHKSEIIELASRYRLPAVYPFRFFPAEGGLASYGIVVADLFRQAAGYVDRILKGERPGDLPVQQPTKFELVINLKTAKALGLDVPPTVLAIADEVIE